MTIMQPVRLPVNTGSWKERAEVDVPPDTSGFARAPHRLMRDHRLSFKARVAVCALEFFARTDAVCWPSNALLGEYMGIDPGNAKDALAELEALGYIRREPVRPHRENMTGRVIHLCWNEPPAARTLPIGVIGSLGGGGAIAPSPIPERNGRVGRTRPDPQGACAPEGGAHAPPKEEGEETKKTLRDGCSHSEDNQTPKPGPRPSLPEQIAALPGSPTPEAAASVAHAIGRELGDPTSIGSFRAKAAAVANGESPPQRLLDAVRAGVAAKGKLDRPGAAFEDAWKHWIDVAAQAEATARLKREQEQAEHAAKLDRARADIRSEEPARMIEGAKAFNIRLDIDAAGSLTFTRIYPRDPMSDRALAYLETHRPSLTAHLQAHAARMAELRASLRLTPPGPIPPTAAVVAVPPAELTDGQRLFLGHLKSAQRAIFDALPADRQAAHLRPHESGFRAESYRISCLDLRQKPIPPAPTYAPISLPSLVGAFA